MIRLIAVLVLLAAPSVLHAQVVDGTLKKTRDYGLGAFPN